MENAAKEPAVTWNKDGRPINWNGRDWQLYRRQMLSYLTCVDIKENEEGLNEICDGMIEEQDTWSAAKKASYKRHNIILAKLISSSLSRTLARQVMRFDSGREIWEYLAKRYEGRENATTTLCTQRFLRQKLETATCRRGADVETHLSNLMSLREQLAAVAADLSDAWMVDILVRSMSQLEYYDKLKMLTLFGGAQLQTPLEPRSLILTLEKDAAVERLLHRPDTGRPRPTRGVNTGISTRTGGKKRTFPAAINEQAPPQKKTKYMNDKAQ